jgi:hypothetical protein
MAIAFRIPIPAHYRAKEVIRRTFAKVRVARGGDAVVAVAGNRLTALWTIGALAWIGFFAYTMGQYFLTVYNDPVFWVLSSPAIILWLIKVPLNARLVLNLNARTMRAQRRFLWLPVHTITYDLDRYALTCGYLMHEVAVEHTPQSDVARGARLISPILGAAVNAAQTTRSFNTVTTYTLCVTEGAEGETLHVLKLENSFDLEAILTAFRELLPERVLLPEDVDESFRGRGAAE